MKSRRADSQSARAGWRAGATFLLALACASAPQPPPVPPPMVPRAAVEVMCTRMHAEGMNGELRVVKNSQPLITASSIEALADAMFYRGRSVAPVTAEPSVPVETHASCSPQAIEAINPRDSDVMVLQFSSPFENPFMRGQLGVIARLSLGNEAPTWYWIPIGKRSGVWGAATPLMLAVRD
jgi:hypothetical protein